MTCPTPAQIMQVLALTGRPAWPCRARATAREIRLYGSLDRAVAALGQDESSRLLSDLLAYRAGLAERADPALRIARLRRDARDLDARAGPAWAEAAEFTGRARYRQLQGDTDLAAAFLRRAEAAERLAASYEDRALALRLEADALAAADERSRDWREVLQALAA